MDKVQVLNIGIAATTQESLCRDLKEGVLVTPNLDHLVMLQNDYDFYCAYRKAEWVVCDSTILFWCSKLLKRPIPRVIQGSTFFELFYKYHATQNDCSIFLLGAKEGVAEKAMNNINSSVNKNIVVGCYSPYFGFENDENENLKIVQIINESKANVVVVGLGAPKQEKWIMKYKDLMPNVKIWMALGATIDFEANFVRRAPVFIQKCGLEWLFRFIQEPKRLFRRYFINDPKFFYYFFKQLIGKYKNPFND